MKKIEKKYKRIAIAATKNPETTQKIASADASATLKTIKIYM